MEISEAFEGENSSFRKTFDEAVRVRSVEEIVEELVKKDFYVFGEAGMGINTNKLKDELTQALQAERQKRDEMVEAERDRIWREVSFKTPALSANWPNGATYNTGVVAGWNICKNFIKEALTQPNNQ
jgi:hypothetical protein